MMKPCLIAPMCLYPAGAIAQQVAWETPFWWGNDLQGADKTVAVNLIHFYNGDNTIMKALSLSFENPDSRLWTPPAVGSLPGSPGLFEPDDVPSYLFCGGHSALADGRVLHVGGVFVPNADLFNPFLPGNPWNNPVDPPSMAYQPVEKLVPQRRQPRS